MRPARNALTLLLIIACASRISCQYDDSFDAGGSSDQNDDENESGSQEVNDADDDGGGGDEVGTGVAGRRSEDTSTTRSYGSSMAEEQNAPPKHKAIILQIVYSNDEKKNADDSIEMTTANRVQEHFGDYLPRRPFPVQGPEEPRKDVPQGGSPYIRYQGGYAPYFGRYFNQLSSRFGSSDKPHYSPPEPQMFNASSHVSSPSNGLTYAFASGQYEVNGGNGGSDSVENLSNGDRNTQEENVDYLRKLRNMAVIARLRKHYALQMSPPLIQPQQGTITRIVTAAGTHFPAEEPKTTVVLAAHKTTQALSEEMEMLRSRLRSMEIEQIKLRTILIQVKGILTEMQERSDAFRTSPAGLNMSQHEVGVARLRNLFLILRAVTQLSPLTSDEIRQINYDVGIFDPKITYDSKGALIYRLAGALRRRAHENGDDASNRNAEATVRLPKAKGCQHSEGQSPVGKSLHFLGFSAPSPSSVPVTGNVDISNRREILQCKLRRLRNLYLLVRPFVTGTKLTREELREIFQNHDDLFEPGMNENQKIELISKMAETIRMAHLSQELTQKASANTGLTMPSARASVSTAASTDAPFSSKASPVSPFMRLPLLIITQRLKNDLPSRPTPPADKMHVSGKIQMDLDIEGNVDSTQEGAISKLF